MHTYADICLYDIRIFTYLPRSIAVYDLVGVEPRVEGLRTRHIRRRAAMFHCHQETNDQTEYRGLCFYL
jgi:hypothetical protein